MVCIPLSFDTPLWFPYDHDDIPHVARNPTSVFVAVISPMGHPSALHMSQLKFSACLLIAFIYAKLEKSNRCGLPSDFHDPIISISSGNPWHFVATAMGHPGNIQYRDCGGDISPVLAKSCDDRRRRRVSVRPDFLVFPQVSVRWRAGTASVQSVQSARAWSQDSVRDMFILKLVRINYMQ